MEIKLIKNEDGDDVQRYEHLAREHGTVFNTEEWHRLFGDKLLRYGIYDDKEELIGGFCLYRDNRYGFTILRNPPFTPTCGPFIKIASTNPISILETKRNVLTEMAHFLNQHRYAVISVSLDRDIDDALPFYWKKFKTIPRYTYLIDLRQPAENIKQQMAPDRKANISRALKAGISVQKVTEMPLVKKFVLDTFNRLNKRINTQYLDAILFKFSNESNSFALAAYWDGVPVACHFVVYDARTAYALLGGRAGEANHKGANALTFFESILQAKELGLQTFDFEGSVIPSVERYFRGFGGRLTPYFTVNKAWLPLEMALKTIKRELF